METKKKDGEKRSDKICICSVILGELECFFSKLQGLQYHFTSFGCNLTYYESENFADSPLHHIFESGNLAFLFSTKIA